MGNKIYYAIFAKQIIRQIYIFNFKDTTQVSISAMKITLLAIGKTDNKLFQEIIADYQKRLNFYIPFEISCLPDIKNAKNLSVSEQKEKEGELILKQTSSSDTLLLLDERGKEYRSVEFAEFVQKKMSSSSKNILFVIGGPYGFSDSVYARANGLVSLSKMTFSHQMVRLIFVEQLYRAMTILKGEPYHHE